MPSEPRPAFYTLRTTSDQQATIYVPPDDDPWQAATQYARASFESDSHLAELRIATQAEIAAYTAQPEATLSPASCPEPASGAAPAQLDAPALDQPPARSSCGAMLNLSRSGRDPDDYPVWASRWQQETWRSGVLVIWTHELRRIIGAFAEQVLDLLAPSSPSRTGAKRASCWACR